MLQIRIFHIPNQQQPPQQQQPQPQQPHQQLQPIALPAATDTPKISLSESAPSTVSTPNTTPIDSGPVPFSPAEPPSVHANTDIVPSLVPGQQKIYRLSHLQSESLSQSSATAGIVTMPPSVAPSIQRVSVNQGPVIRFSPVNTQKPAASIKPQIINLNSANNIVTSSSTPVTLLKPGSNLLSRNNAVVRIVASKPYARGNVQGVVPTNATGKIVMMPQTLSQTGTVGAIGGGTLQIRPTQRFIMSQSGGGNIVRATTPTTVTAASGCDPLTHNIRMITTDQLARLHSRDHDQHHHTDQYDGTMDSEDDDDDEDDHEDEDHEEEDEDEDGADCERNIEDMKSLAEAAAAELLADDNDGNQDYSKYGGGGCRGEIGMPDSEDPLETLAAVATSQRAQNSDQQLGRTALVDVLHYMQPASGAASVGAAGVASVYLNGNSTAAGAGLMDAQEKQPVIGATGAAAAADEVVWYDALITTQPKFTVTSYIAIPNTTGLPNFNVGFRWVIALTWHFHGAGRDN